MANGLVVRAPYPNSGSTNPNINRNIHAEMVQLLDSAPGWQRIASYYGSAGTGLDATGGANPSGEEAFVVYRNVSGSQPYDVAIKWSWSNFYAAGAFEAGISNWGVGITVAFHSSSQAWNGTTANNGTDSFPSGQPWKSGSVIFPRQNAFGGVHATEGDREYMGLFSLSLNTGNMISACDNENIFFAYNDSHISNSTGTHKTLFYFGKYVPESGSGVNFPYIYCAEDTTTSIFSIPGVAYGGTAETNDSNHGVSFISSSVPDVISYTLSFDLTSTTNSGTVPRTSGSVLNEYPIYIIPNENIISGQPSGSNIGTLGRLDFIRLTRATDVANLDRVDSDTKLILSRSAAGTGGAVNPAFITIPWISGTLMPTGSSTNKTSNFVLPVTGGGTTTISRTPIFRGENPPGTYVYSQGTPPNGATNVIIIGYV